MKNRADVFFVCSFIAAFVGPDVLSSISKPLHDLLCNPAIPADCLLDIRLVALLLLTVKVCGGISAYYLFRKTSMPVGTNIAAIPQGQAPVTQATNKEVPGMQYAPTDAKGNIGDSIPINGIQVKAGA